MTKTTQRKSNLDHQQPFKEQEEEEEESSQSFLNIADGSDVCKAIMDRYARSYAPQHRHLCASAAAMRSILLDEGLPLTPAAYFAAAITAFRDSDPEAVAALSAFLAILIPLVPAEGLSPAKAREAAACVAAFLREEGRSGGSTGSVRSLVKSLGFLVLRVDLEDWNSVEIPLEILLKYALDKRPKVRRCAQVYVEKLFKKINAPAIRKSASKTVLSMFNKHIDLAEKFIPFEVSHVPSGKILLKAESMDILHVLSVVKLTIPYLHQRVNTKILLGIYKHLGCHFTLLTKHMLCILEALVDCCKVEVLVEESENILSSIISYISVGNKNPVDAFITSSTLLKNFLHKLHDTEPSISIRNLHLAVTSVAGYLCSDVETSKHAASVLKDLFNLIDCTVLPIAASHLSNDGKESTPEIAAITSICTVFDNMLTSCNISEQMLEVISVLLLKLGGISYLFMKDIVVKLSRHAAHKNEDTPHMGHIHECMGAAVIAIGPEKVLSLVPITLDKGKMTCSNRWLIPILKKYVIGATLQYFIEHVLPLASSLRMAYNKAMKASAVKRLQTCFYELWGLLPAFCHFPTDISQSFEPLSKLLIVAVKEDSSLHQTVAIALQELVNGSKLILKANQATTQDPKLLIGTSLETAHMDLKVLPLRLSKQTASRNIKALAASSMHIIRTLTDIYFDSPQEKRSYLKEAIGSLASITENASNKNFFISLVEKFELTVPSSESDVLMGDVQDDDKKEDVGQTVEAEKYEEMKCLVMELASSLVEAADEHLINIIFDYIKPSLLVLAADEIHQNKAYYTLSILLKEHSWFCLTREAELIDLLLGTKVPDDCRSMEQRFSCFHYLLVHILKSNDEKTCVKAFLVLNEIILTLKSKKESRKLAYDLLLHVSSSLKNSESSNAESDLGRLFYMVMGYLSSSSTHVMSGAIAALSLLVHSNPGFSLAVPNLITSVLVLLKKKDIEVIKAALGFVKVLVSSLQSIDLVKLLPDIVNAILPWSSVSKHHFRSKVGMIFEILVRKCGYDAVELRVPAKHKGFLEKISETRESRKHSKTAKFDEAQDYTDSKASRGMKRASEDAPSSLEKHFGEKKFQKAKTDGPSSTNKSYKNSPRSAKKKRRRDVTISDCNSQEQERGMNEKKRKSFRGKPRQSGKKNNRKNHSNKFNATAAAAASQTNLHFQSNKRRKLDDSKHNQS